MLQAFADAYDNRRKSKVRTLYRNLRMEDQEYFDMFMSKFTAYTTKGQKHGQHDQVRRSVRQAHETAARRHSPTPPLYLTFTNLREQISLLYREREPEKNLAPPTTTNRRNFTSFVRASTVTSKPASSTHTIATSSNKPPSARIPSANTDIKKQELGQSIFASAIIKSDIWRRIVKR